MRVRKLSRSRALQVVFRRGSVLGIAALCGATACNALLGNEEGHLVDFAAGAGHVVESGGANSSGGATAHGGTTASGGAVSSGGVTAHGGATASGGGGGKGGGGGRGGGGGKGGAGGSAGKGTSGGGAGTGGTGTVCTSPSLIDDLEDGDNAIAPCEGRIGYWFSYNDPKVAGCSQTPSGSMFTATLGGTAPSKYAARVFGSNCGYSGFGFDFRNVLVGLKPKSMPYDASAYVGIRLSAKGSLTPIGTLNIAVPIPATTSDAEDSGTCVATATQLCDDHFFDALPLTPNWLPYEIRFDDPVNFHQGSPPSAVFNAKQLIGIRIQLQAGTQYDVWVDDLRFF